jgi:riboflavin biosynthesis pyrimidine reductase
MKKFGSNVLVEGGANFIFDLISARSLDGIYLSVTPESGGEEKIDYQELLAMFSEVTSREVDGTHFFEARTLKA